MLYFSIFTPLRTYSQILPIRRICRAVDRFGVFIGQLGLEVACLPFENTDSRVEGASHQPLSARRELEPKDWLSMLCDLAHDLAIETMVRANGATLEDGGTLPVSMFQM